MIVKGIIEEVKNNGTRVKVRIPRIDKASQESGATPTEYLPDADICVIPGIKVNYKRGDTVFVGFQDNTYSKPIVLGYVMLPDADTKWVDKSTVQCSSIEVKNTAYLPDLDSIKSDGLSLLSCISNELKIEDQTASKFPSLEDFFIQ